VLLHYCTLKCKKLKLCNLQFGEKLDQSGFRIGEPEFSAKAGTGNFNTSDGLACDGANFLGGHIQP